jgi:Rps23 Pro-64 3,4-dihydroxylase Tpa1-like proline 4-hydroxylase
MWLNGEQVIDSMVDQYRESLLCSCPNHVVIDGLFDESTLDEVMSVLQQSRHWKTQQHTYAALYVGSAEWNNASKAERFVQRDVWQRGVVSANQTHNIAHEFLSYLRSDEFMSVLSCIFNVQLTDINVADPEINTNYFRLAPTDFVEQHADDSPGRKVCMLLYLNKDWSHKAGGKLGFAGAKVGKEIHKQTSKKTSKDDSQPMTIAPLYNRCVLFDPSSEGSEHWVEKLHAEYAGQYRYNVTSWYWGE